MGTFGTLSAASPRAGPRCLAWAAASCAAAAVAAVTVPPVVEDGATIALREVASFSDGAATPGPLRLSHIVPSPDGTDRLFIAAVAGQVRIFASGALAPRPFLDVAAERGARFLTGERELGLIALAFHPDYARSGAPGFGRFYTVHTETPTSSDETGVGATNEEVPVTHAGASPRRHHVDVLTEWSVSADDPGRADPASGRKILRIVQPYADHNVGFIGFNPHAAPRSADFGMLYIGIGDGGDTALRGREVDADRQAQDLGSPLGKILRIDPLTQGARPYTVPYDNPLRDRTGAMPEIWAYGFRKPRHAGWDENGMMLVADSGGRLIEEINLIVAGGNYGWSEKHGTFLVDHSDGSRLLPDPTPGAEAGFIDPVAQYGGRGALAATGGWFYRGSTVPALRGKYVFGDAAGGRLFYLNIRDIALGTQTPVHELSIDASDERGPLDAGAPGTGHGDLLVAHDGAGELYLYAASDGTLNRIERPTAGSAAGDDTPAPPARPAGDTARSLVDFLLYTAGGLLVLATLFLGVLLRRSARATHRHRHGATPVKKSRSSRRNKTAAPPEPPAAVDPVPTAHAPRRAPTRAYHSTVSHRVLELHSEEGCLGLKQAGAQTFELTIPLAEVAAIAIHANGGEIAAHVRPVRAPLDDAGVTRIRDALRRVETRKLAHGESRTLDLVISHGADGERAVSVNFYAREGRYRKSRYDFDSSIEHILSWYRTLVDLLADRRASAPRHGDAPVSPSAETHQETGLEAAPEAATATATQPAGPPADPRPELTAELRALAELHARGLLTDDEFQRLKARLLGS